MTIRSRRRSCGGVLATSGTCRGRRGAGWGGRDRCSRGQVQAAGALVGGFEVGGYAGVVVEGVVVGVQQRGASALALGVGVDGEDGQVVVGEAGGVTAVEGGVEGAEPVGPAAGGGGQPRGIVSGFGGAVHA